MRDPRCIITLGNDYCKQRRPAGFGWEVSDEPFGFDVGERGEKVGDVIEKLEWLGGMGIQTVLGWVIGVDRIRPLEIMGREVIPAVAELGPPRPPTAVAT